MTAISLTNVQPFYLSQASDFIAAGGLGTQLVRKFVSFDDTTGTVPLFTVAGDVILRIIAICQAACASSGGCDIEVGILGDTDAILPATDVTLFVAGHIWQDDAPDAFIEPLDTALLSYVVGNGQDIRLTLSAQVDAGAMMFYCFWTPLSVGASVVPA